MEEGGRRKSGLFRESIQKGEKVGPVTRRSRLEKRRDETRRITFYLLGLVSRLVSELFVSRPNRRDRLVSRLVTCCLDLVSSRDFRLVTGPRRRKKNAALARPTQQGESDATDG